MWSWVLVEQLAQDVRYGLRGMAKNRLFTMLAALSLALGIGANTAIYSFMDAILLRSLPVADPASLVVVKWRSKPVSLGNGRQFVLHAIDGSTYDDRGGVTAAIFPFPAFERLHDMSAPVLSSLFAHKAVGRLNVSVNGEAELVQGEYVSGDFFRGIAVLPAAGRMLDADDDRAGAPRRGPEPGIQPAPLRGGRCCSRAADPHQQRIVHRRRRRACRVLWCGSVHRTAGLSSRCTQVLSCSPTSRSLSIRTTTGSK